MYPGKSSSTIPYTLYFLDKIYTEINESPQTSYQTVVNIPRYLMSTVQFLLPFNQLFLLVREIDKLIQGLFVHMAIPFQFLVAILKFFEEL